MAEFIVVDILMISLAAFLFVSARAFARLPETNQEGKKSLWERIMATYIPDRLDDVAHSFHVKALRRLRVVILRWENRVARSLRALREEDEKQRIDFSKMYGEEKKDEQTPTDFLG